MRIVLMKTPTPAVVAAVAAVAAGGILAACSPGAGAQPGAAPLDVLTTVYPLQYVAERVGGPDVSTTSLTPPGVDAHALELAPHDVAQLDAAGLVLYLSGFQAAVDDAVEQTTPDHVLDVATLPGVAAHLQGAADAGHAEQAHDHGHGHDHGGADPHFWLDPTLLASVADGVAAELAAADPAHAADYRTRAENLAVELTALDEEFSAALEVCESRTLVVAHAAYGFLGERYDLTQVGVSGLDPESEPSPARLAEIADVVRQEGVTTIFAERLVNPAVAETLAGEVGVEVAVLDPLDGRLDQTKDYQEIMRDNLQALREGLRCA
ncbi:zinc ABC transporter substrate-binding protein [Georgenia yuyongxinii]|uniref:Zinc ABC transporter substrate-binding protein n=2 Tax=Georgenia yuyongxinii TaxID=2589797 RepID=A0A552WRQ5_9MICO|nr:zinc ABC transporter substrate-binding protein [Georgenia yuyongxinii]